MTSIRKKGKKILSLPQNYVFFLLLQNLMIWFANIALIFKPFSLKCVKFGKDNYQLKENINFLNSIIIV